MNRIFRIFPIFLATLLTTFATAETTRETLVSRIVNAEYALEEIMSKPETSIPSSVLKDAKGIILTVDYRGSFIIGGHGGFGVLIAKHPLTGEWGVPAFIQTGGANIGLQLGGKEIDNIYVIMDDDTIRKAYTGRFDLSASAAAVAGPVAAVSEANESDDYNNANILVYSTTKGLFAGVSIKAGWVAPQNKMNKKFYNTHYNTPEIVLSDWFEMPPESVSLIQRINYYMNGGH